VDPDEERLADYSLRAARDLVGKTHYRGDGRATSQDLVDLASSFIGLNGVVTHSNGGEPDP
jgi:hypothetical protein